MAGDFWLYDLVMTSVAIWYELRTWQGVYYLFFQSETNMAAIIKKKKSETHNFFNAI